MFKKISNIKKNKKIIQAYFINKGIRGSIIVSKEGINGTISAKRKILEIGTFTGLSSLTMSLSLPKDGELITIDKSAERNKIASNFFRKAKQENKITGIIGSALESLSNLKKKEQKFDLVFIDADKENYKNYYNESLDLIEKNGLIIVDNVLWHGEVVDEENQDNLTINIREFNSYVNKDKRTENLIIPIGDGITICRKL